MASSDKIRSLADLAGALGALRERGKRIVHCHGCFDLLHIGHIRYLQKASKLGDVLVVTVTPDHFVNKGPHRPAFPQVLRAEALAALDCVSFVAINEWPTAVETLELLQPHVYAKGAEYRTNRTPEIMREEAAAAAVGTDIVFIEEITSSSSELINRHLSPFPREVDAYLVRLSEQYGANGLLACLEHAKDLKVLVVGEAIVDEYYYCGALQRSLRSPVLAMRYLSHERFAGGAVGVANHLADFCGEVGLLATIGTRDSQEQWLRDELRPGVEPLFVTKADAPTIVKRRYLESYFALPLLEVYVMNDEPPTAEDDAALCARLTELIPAYDLVLVADYGHGMLSAQAVTMLCGEARYLALTAQANAGNYGYHTVGKYPRADYVCLAEQEIRLEYRTRVEEVRELAESLGRRLNAGHAVVTQGKRGALGWRPTEGFHEAPSLATRITDRVGAFDAFYALSALCAFQDAPLEVLSFVGNVAAAEVLATMGNRPILERLPLRRHIEALLR